MRTALVCYVCYELTWVGERPYRGSWAIPRKWWTCKNCMEDQ